MLKGNYATKHTNAVIGQDKSVTYNKTLISLQKNINKKGPLTNRACLDK